MCLTSISCTMGNFYKTLQTQYEWLASANGIDPATATACIASYYTTFCHGEWEGE